MGDIFSLSLRRFRGHAVENSFVAQGPPALGRSGAGTPSIAPTSLPPFRRQPQDGLQMVDAISSSWPSRLARSVASSAPLAPPSPSTLDQRHRPVAPASSALGRQKDSSATSPKTSASARPLCADDPALAQTEGVGGAAPATSPARSSRAATGADGADAVPSGVDGGFQRLVPHGRRSAPGTTDGARSVQPLWIVSAPFAQPGRSPRASRDAAVVPRARSARSDPRGQWFAFWRQGRAGTLASVSLVDAAGHSRRVHPASAARRQRRARTIS